jgi:FkbM family methyltransferase
MNHIEIDGIKFAYIGNIDWQIRGMYEEVFELHGYDSERCRIEEGDIVVDCGANTGVFSAYAARCGASRIIAIEPGQDNVLQLEETARLNGFMDKLTIINKGVHAHKGRLLFANCKNQPSASEFIYEYEVPYKERHPYFVYEYEYLDVDTLDNLMRDLRIEKADFIKMDIEGCERYAVAGACETIKASSPKMAICTYHFPGDEEEILGRINLTGIAYDIERFAGPEQWHQSIKLIPSHRKF